MKTLILLIPLVLTLSACEKKQPEKEHPIAPVSSEETRALLHHLRLGLPLDDVQLQDENCQAFQNSLPPDFTKGFITVPEDYDHPEGRQIQVFYYGRLEKGKDPVVFYNGGPASDSHGSYSLLNSLPQAQNLSFIYIDQRGTGCSDPFPQTPANLENVQRLAHYTSLEITKDSEFLRRKLLGEKSKWKIFGQSYGGQIVHRYSIVAPQSLKAAYAHGLSLMADQTEWLKLRIKSQKRVSEMYFSEYPEDRQTLAEIRRQIQDDVCFNDGSTKICGAKVMDAATMLLGFSNYWPDLHWTLESILPPGGELNTSQLDSFVRTFVFGIYNNNGLAASVISLVEMSNPDSEADSCIVVMKRLESEGENPQSWLINECRLLSGLQNDQWNELFKTVKLNTMMTPAQFKSSLNSHPELPFFLYSGEKDVFVPIETFAEEIHTLGKRITYRQFSNTGHDGFYTEEQIWNDLLSVQ